MVRDLVPVFDRVVKQGKIMEICDRIGASAPYAPGLGEISSAGFNKRILVIDDCSFRRESLRLMLASRARDFLVESVPAACLVKEQHYDAVLLSVDSADKDGSGACASLALIRSAVGEVPVAAFGEAAFAAIAGRLMRDGFNGIILMSLEVDLVVAGLRLLCAGGTFLPRDVLGVDETRSAGARHDGDWLTPREKQILGLVGEGRQNKIIAHHLGISESTVKVHLQRIMRKMGASNRTEVALRARGRTFAKDGVARVPRFAKSDIALPAAQP